MATPTAQSLGITFSQGAQATPQGVANAQATNMYGYTPPTPNSSGSTVVATGGVAGTNPPQPTNPPPAPGGGTPPAMAESIARANGTSQMQTPLQNAQSSYQNTLQNPPSSYDLYQQELQSRGINTLTQQEADLGNSINAQEAALKPLLPENVAINFPKSLQQLQDIGVNQDQLNLLAAKERTPIAAALSDLLKSQSVIAQQIDRQISFSQYAVKLRQDDYQNKVTAAQQALQLATNNNDQAAKAQATAQLFAATNNISSPYYNQAGTIVRTSDGYQFTSESDFRNKTGMDVGIAQSQGLIQQPSAAPLALKDAPASYQEYVLAKNDGFTGSYTDYQNADANRKAKASGTGNSPTVIKANHQEEVANHLDNLAGRDGYVSPNDWKAAQRAWVVSNYGTAASFVTNFKNYINPADAQDYK